MWGMLIKYFQDEVFMSWLECNFVGSFPHPHVHEKSLSDGRKWFQCHHPSKSDSRKVRAPSTSMSSTVYSPLLYSFSTNNPHYYEFLGIQCKAIVSQPTSPFPLHLCLFIYYLLSYQIFSLSLCASLSFVTNTCTPTYILT